MGRQVLEPHDSSVAVSAPPAVERGGWEYCIMRTEGTGSSQAPSLGPPHIRGEVTVTIINYVITQEEPHTRGAFPLVQTGEPRLVWKSGFVILKCPQLVAMSAPNSYLPTVPTPGSCNPFSLSLWEKTKFGLKVSNMQPYCSQKPKSIILNCIKMPQESK